MTHRQTDPPRFRGGVRLNLVVGGGRHIRGPREVRPKGTTNATVVASLGADLTWSADVASAPHHEIEPDPNTTICAP